jgi:hypothetical protein
MALFPGKGTHLVLNQEVGNFISLCMEQIAEVYSDDLHDNDPKAVLNYLFAHEDAWTEQEDNFGHKAYKSMPYKKGELRVTVVLTKQNELRIDIREWYEPLQGR